MATNSSDLMEKLFPGWSKVPLRQMAPRKTAAVGYRGCSRRSPDTRTSRRIRSRRRDTKAAPRAIFLRPVIDRAVDNNLDCRNSHEVSRSTAADRHPRGLYFHFRKRLCRVDAWIPGPGVFRGKGVDTHAIDLGGLRALGTRATDLRPAHLGERSPPRGVAVTQV